MQTTKRPPETDLIGRLAGAPQRFGFFQAMRILLRWLDSQGVPRDQAWSQVLRFHNSLSLNFPAGEIEALDLAAKRADGGPRVTLTPAFFGLLGAHGTLPAHRTDTVAAALHRHGDAGVRAFIDLFSQRMTALFFQAWEKYRLESKSDTPEADGLLPLLMDVAGLRAGVFSCPGDSDEAAAYYAALLRTRPVAPSSVARVLGHHFGVPVELEQFVAAWDKVPDQLRTRLGGETARLGHGAMLGGRVMRRDRRVRLNIGPLGKEELERFLPGGTASAALARMVSLFGLSHLEFEVKLILKPCCIQPLVLTREPGTGGRLGWDAFLLGSHGKASSNTITYLLSKPVRTNSSREAPCHQTK